MKDTFKSDFVFNPGNWSTPNTYGENFKMPPEKSGVYLLTHTYFDDFGAHYEILYVGSAKNLKVRYDRHEVRRVLMQVYSYVQFYFKEEINYKQIERYLIKTIQPKFNKQWR